MISRQSLCDFGGTVASFLTACARATAAAAVSLLSGTACAAAPADVVLTDGKPRSAGAGVATAVAIRDGKIVYVGDDAGACARAGAETLVFDLGGKTIAPGFRDSHMHPMSGGMRFLRCNLRDATTPAAVRETVRACAAKDRAESWLVGYGLQIDSLPHGILTAEELDALSPEAPAFLSTDDGDEAWVNSAARAAAGLPIGEGVVAGESAAQARAAIPRPTQETYRRALSATLKEATRFGITSIFDASVTPEMLDAYVAAAKARELTARIRAAQLFICDDGPEQIGAAMHRARAIHDPFLRADGMKIFLDGEFAEHTAAGLEDYADAPGRRGEICMPQRDLDIAVREMQRRGLQAHFHAMGDGAVRAALNALAAAAAPSKLRKLRHQITHVGLVAPEDIERFRALGVVAGYQPFLPQADELAASPARTRLGAKRAAGLYPFGALARAGADIEMGSDWPAPLMNPAENIEAALARPSADDRLDRELLLAAYSGGRVETGADADLIVVDGDITNGGRVLLTLVAGREVWRDAALRDTPASCRLK